MLDKSKKAHRAQEPDRYSRDVERVAEFIAQQVVRGRDLSGLLFDCGSQFPCLRLSVFCDALRLVHTRGGGDALGRTQ